MLILLCVGTVVSAGISLAFFARSRTAWSRTEHVHELVHDLVCKSADTELGALAASRRIVLLGADARQARYGVTVKGKGRRLTAGATVQRLDSGDFQVALTMQVTDLAPN